jgi:signal transduction histidine kinase
MFAMARSIRWRLVASYMLLTLLSVSLVGALALSLIQQHSERQENEYLTSNANAIAQQAASLMWPVMRLTELQRLAQTSAFLGNVQVRFLTPQQQLMADSGPSSPVDEYVWVLTPEQLNLSSDDADQRYIMSLLLNNPGVIMVRGRRPNPQDQMPPGTKLTLVQRRAGPWGNRFTFVAGDDASGSAGAATPAPSSDPSPATTDSVPRSDQVVRVAINNSGRLLGYVELSGAPNFGAETQSAAAQAFLFAALGATGIAGMVGLFVGRGLTSPLKSLALAANHMSAGDLSARAPVAPGGHDEIGQVARQFNQMAERLQSSFEELAAERDTLRRFIADASHELRTPITALKTFNELMQGPAADDPAARAEFLSESQTQIERLQWITNNLLNLSRLDAGLAHLDVAEHDVGEILQSSAVPFRRLAQDRGIDFQVHAPEPPIALRCDRARMELALSNLIDNAIKFTPSGGHVEIGANTASDCVQLWVHDDGRGIDPTDQPHIFERFYRGKVGNVRGSGLGLALVKSVVLAHGGQVMVTSEVGRGSRFVISVGSSQ